MTLVLVNTALIAQRGVDYRLYFGYNRAEIDAEVARTDRVIAALTRIIESQSDRTFQQEGLVGGGALWVALQNDVPGQALRNLYESKGNLRGIPSAVEEWFGRFFGGRSTYGGFAFDAIPPANAQTDFERQMLAEAFKNRHEAYRKWLLRYRY